MWELLCSDGQIVIYFPQQLQIYHYLQSISIQKIKPYHFKMNSHLIFQHPNNQYNMVFPSFSNAFDNIDEIFQFPLQKFNGRPQKSSNSSSSMTSMGQNGKIWQLPFKIGTSISLRIRTPNNLKNKFYTVLRNLVKFMFRHNPSITPKVRGEISSRDLSRLYDGSSTYAKFQGILRSILQAIEYDIKHSSLLKLCEERCGLIRQIYQAIYKEKAEPISQGNNSRPQQPQTIQQNHYIDAEIPQIPPSRFSYENSFSQPMGNLWFFSHNSLNYYYMIGQQRPEIHHP